MSAFDQVRRLETALAAPSGPDFASAMEVLRTAAASRSVLRAVGGCAKGMERLFSLDFVRTLSAADMDVFLSFLETVPYRPATATYPCGQRDFFVADILRDRTLPTSLRARTWRLVALGGLKLPRYAHGRRWHLPDELLDHPAAREWYCEQEKPGWEFVRCTSPVLFREPQVWEPENKMVKDAYDAIPADVPARVILPLDICGSDVPEPFFLEILARQAVETALFLFLERGHLAKALSREQFLIYVAIHWDVSCAMRVFTAFESAWPGISASRDTLGRTSLLYTLYRRVPCPELQDFLIRKGCDADCEVLPGLSYADISQKCSVRALPSRFGRAILRADN